MSGIGKLGTACLRALVVAGAAVAIAAPTAAQTLDVALPLSTPTSADASSTAATPVSLDDSPQAVGVYAQMARYLAAQQTFFVELMSTTTITGSGKERVSGGLSRVWYRRPDHVVWTTQSDIGASALAIDGQNSTLFLPSLSKYMVAPVKNGIDAQVASMSSPFGPLTTALFASDTTSSLETVLTGPPKVLGDDFVLGVHCSRVSVPTRAGEVELWVAQGPIPLPVKISSGMSIPASPGQDNAIESKTEVSFRWRVNVELPDSTFQLKLPETAMRADKLGSPIVAAKLNTKETQAADKKSKSSSSKSSSKSSSSSSRKKDSSNRDFDLAFEPPPTLNEPMTLPSAFEGGPGADSLPSLGGSRDVVSAAIQGSKPDSVPSGASYQPSQEREAPPPPSSSAQSPGVQLQMLDGRSVNLASYKGRKAVVLDFWATWCGPCKQSMPVVNQLANSYRGRGVEFFAVNMAEAPGDIQQFIQKQGLTLPVATDPSGQLAAAFGVSGIPHLVVIGKDGTVKGTHTGADPSLAQSLQRDLEIAIK